MPQREQLRRLWTDIEAGWKEVHEALGEQREALSKEPRDLEFIAHASERVRRALSAHSKAVGDYTALFNAVVEESRKATAKR